MIGSGMFKGSTYYLNINCYDQSFNFSFLSRDFNKVIEILKEQQYKFTGPELKSGELLSATLENITKQMK